MPKASSALEKALARAAEIAAQQGQSLDPVNLADIPTPIEYEKQEAEKKENQLLEYEGVSLQLHYKHALMMKKCRWCKRAFQTSYCYVALCSDDCRREEFRQSYGIDMNSIRSRQSFWENEKPIIVSPETTERLVEWARTILSQYEEVQASEPPARMEAIPPEVRAEGQNLRTEYRREQVQHQLSNLEVVDLAVEESPSTQTLESSPTEEGGEAQANPQSTLDNLDFPSFDF